MRHWARGVGSAHLLARWPTRCEFAASLTRADAGRYGAINSKELRTWSRALVYGLVDGYKCSQGPNPLRNRKSLYHLVALTIEVVLETWSASPGLYPIDVRIGHDRPPSFC